MEALRAEYNARGLQLGELFGRLATALNEVAGAAGDAHVHARLEPGYLRSITLRFGGLPVPSVQVGRSEVVAGAALHFAESTSRDLVCTIVPYRFRDDDGGAADLQQLRDPLTFDLEAELPPLLRRFFDVATRSHPYRSVAGLSEQDREQVPTAAPAPPEAADTAQGGAS